MAEFAVLGFRNGDGTLGFGLTSRPLGYIAKTRAGIFNSHHIEDSARLELAIPVDSHATGTQLRDRLNLMGTDAALAHAASMRTRDETVQAIRVLAEQLQSALIGGSVLKMVHDAALQALGNTAAVDKAVALDCPFAELPDPGDLLARFYLGPQIDLVETECSAAIFDLDATLLDTDALREARDEHRWQEVMDRLEEVREFPSWSSVKPHELPMQLAEGGIGVAVVSRAPIKYVQELIERFEIHADEVIGSCGKDKVRAFWEARKALRAPSADSLVVFGDDSSDFVAANAMGCRSFGNPWINELADSRCAPDIAWFDAATLLSTDRWIHRLPYVGEASDPPSVLWHRGSLLSYGDDGFALGRYFNSHHVRHSNLLSQAVLAQKETEQRVERIAVAFDRAVDHLAELWTWTWSFRHHPTKEEPIVSLLIARPRVCDWTPAMSRRLGRRRRCLATTRSSPQLRSASCDPDVFPLMLT